MLFQKSELPGSHERHLLRRLDNPLFGVNQTELNDDTLMEAQRVDHEEIIEFREGFNKVLEETLGLKPNVDSEDILALKDRMERLYEQAFRIGDDQSEVKEALTKLLMVIMGAIRQGAGNDMQAHQELDQEEQARKAHFSLLESKLIADLLNPESVIKEDHLIPTLLSSNKDELSQVVQIFDESQLVLIIEGGEKLVRKLIEEDKAVPDATENLVFIQGYIEFLSQNKSA